MTQEEYLLDTIEYYSKDPINRRCFHVAQDLHGKDRNFCDYSPITANKLTSEGCGIGRKLDPDVAILWDNTGGASIMDITLNKQLFSLAPEWMQNIEPRFLGFIQSFHDDDNSWDDNGLSSHGKYRLSKAIKEFGLDKELFSKYLN